MYSCINGLYLFSDIKQDIKFLESVIIALFEQLNSEKGKGIITEVLHQMYFAPVKPYLIVLLRLVLCILTLNAIGFLIESMWQYISKKASFFIK